ncbi:NAD-dependent epimerase/dehydratase family protein [Amycolatopsis nigrescens]|uniref:NAD-dependent epimerase/dehydratase family protein n=1 Tax=Amycolatopsis nigrescens TaxID=381445 RepID=UPI000371E012|nr:NAD(P)-dependent oxidoreductase [Amycolatopsis nigrescens]
MHLFLAGSTGVIGERLVRTLTGGGHRVTALTRRTAKAPGLRALGAEPVVADVYDRDALIAAVRLAAPDVLLHQLTDLGAGDLAGNAALRRDGTRNLVDAAHAAGVRRMIAQSISWAYAGGYAPADEQTPLDLTAPEPRQTTVSGVAALESAVLEVAEPVVLRYGLFYGPGTWFEPDGLRAEDARAGRLTVCDDITSFVHIEDAADAAVAALDWAPGIVNITDDEPAPAREWMPAFCTAVGAPAPGETTDTGGRADWARGADNHLAREVLGWTPRYPSWRAGFTDGLR